MKKHLLSLLALCLLGVGNAFAQSEIQTYSVYDVNHDAAVTVDDVTKVVNHALKANGESPQTVDAAALNALLQSIDNRLAKIEEKLGILDEGADEDDSHEYVDLGLPSGTLWATCNVGADNPEDYGYYFAWGEVEPKSTYNWSTYKWMKEGYSDWKGCNKYTFADGQTSGCWYNSGAFVGDNKTELDLEDDAAYMNWGEGWRMPSCAQQDELSDTNNCTWTWTTINGKKGYLVRSKRNDSSLFLPAAGYYGGSSLYDVGSYGYNWSRSLNATGSNGAYYLSFGSSYFDWGGSHRYFGRSVRPVRVSSQN